MDKQIVDPRFFILTLPHRALRTRIRGRRCI